MKFNSKLYEVLDPFYEIITEVLSFLIVLKDQNGMKYQGEKVEWREAMLKNENMSTQSFIFYITMLNLKEKKDAVISFPRSKMSELFLTWIFRKPVSFKIDNPCISGAYYLPNMIFEYTLGEEKSLNWSTEKFKKDVSEISEDFIVRYAEGRTLLLSIRTNHFSCFLLGLYLVLLLKVEQADTSCLKSIYEKRNEIFSDLFKRDIKNAKFFLKKLVKERANDITHMYSPISYSPLDDKESFSSELVRMIEKLLNIETNSKESFQYDHNEVSDIDKSSETTRSNGQNNYVEKDGSFNFDGYYKDNKDRSSPGDDNGKKNKVKSEELFKTMLENFGPMDFNEGLLESDDDTLSESNIVNAEENNKNKLSERELIVKMLSEK